MGIFFMGFLQLLQFDLISSNYELLSYFCLHKMNLYRILSALRSVLWKMNPGLATLRRLFDAVCLKFCESNDSLMEASPLPE